MRILATLVLTLTALMGGTAIANADCKMYIGNGQYAPCPPPIISTESGPLPGGGGHTEQPATEPPSYEYEEPSRTPLPVPFPDGSAEEPAEEVSAE